jgi:hypothetical protein
MSGGNEQVITHIRECRGDPNQQSTLQENKPDKHDICVPADRPRIATFHNNTIWSIWVSHLPSARLSRDTTYWVIDGPYTISMLISREMVEYHPTTTIIKLRRFTGPHKFVMQSVHNQMFV